MVPGNLFSRFYRLRFLGFPFWIKAWQKKIPERSEDDFLLADQPRRAALRQIRGIRYLCRLKTAKQFLV